MKARCKRCGLDKNTNYNNEKCPRCGSFIEHLPVWINGQPF